MNVATAKAQLSPEAIDAELNNLGMSREAQPLFDAVKKHIAENVAPIEEEFERLGQGRADRWSWAPGQLELLEGAKNKAKASGLWNFFLPTSEIGRGLTNLDYAYIAAELGKQPLASETLNCSAPDTGNMEVLERVGTPEQKEKWLKPLLNGDIRSAYAMTEPGVASSDAKNISTRAVLVGDEWVINGEKYYISGAGDPRCKIMICMVKTSPDAPTQFQQSQILVPMDTPGVKIFSGRWKFSVMTMRRAGICICVWTMCACPRRISFWAKAAGSKSRRCGWDRGAFIIACARSEKRNARSI